MIYLVIYLALFSSLAVDVGTSKQIEKWSEISILKMTVLKQYLQQNF